MKKLLLLSLVAMSSVVAMADDLWLPPSFIKNMV